MTEIGQQVGLKAKEIFTRSLQLDSQDPVIYYYLAMSFKQLKQDRQAINFFQIALDLSQPDYLDNLYINLSESLHNERDFVAAIHCLRKAGEFTQSRAIIHYNLANIYYDYYEDKSVALAYYKKAAEDDLSPEVDEFIQYRIKELTEAIFLTN